MHSFSIRDLRQRSGELVRDAEEGRLSLVTKHGRLVFVAVPMSERLLESGVHEALAVKLFQDRVLSLGKAARFAGLGVEAFMEALAASSVDVVDYDPSELDDELAALA
jgi:prevent-host-death family protein